MRIHYLQHVAFEDCAKIGSWARARGHVISRTLLYEEQPFPPFDTIDWLVIMGGPMNIYQHGEYPWLKREKLFIEEAVSRGVVTLGVCLGGQLIADVLGGKVTGNSHAEIGWHGVTLTDEAKSSAVFANPAESFTAFHWHCDTFETPPGAVRIAESQACRNQAFQYSNHVIGLQFHLEYSETSIRQMLENCGEELVESPYVQSSQEILAGMDHITKTEKLLYKLLDSMEQKCFGVCI